MVRRAREMLIINTLAARDKRRAALSRKVEMNAYFFARSTLRIRFEQFIRAIPALSAAYRFSRLLAGTPRTPAAILDFWQRLPGQHPCHFIAAIERPPPGVVLDSAVVRQIGLQHDFAPLLLCRAPPCFCRALLHRRPSLR